MAKKRDDEMEKWRNDPKLSVTILFSLSFRDQLQSYDPFRSQGFSFSRASWFSKRCQIVSLSASRRSKIYISRAPGMECMSLGVIWVSHGRLIENVGM